MAELLVCTLGGREIYDNMSGSRTTIYEQPQKTLLEAVKTPGSTQFKPPSHIDTVFFSGGVADCIYERKADDFPFGDIG